MRESTGSTICMLTTVFAKSSKDYLKLQMGVHRRMYKEGEIWRVQPEFRKL
jgi:hypothetical protein